MQYLGETDIDWTYWALDGFKCEPEKIKLMECLQTISQTLDILKC